MTTDTLRYVCLCLFGVAGAALGTAAVQSVEAARKSARADACGATGRERDAGDPRLREQRGASLRPARTPDAHAHRAQSEARRQLQGHRAALQAARREAQGALGLGLLPDDPRDQRALVHGRRARQAEQFRRPRRHRRRRARRELSRTSRPACSRTCSTSSPTPARRSTTPSRSARGTTRTASSPSRRRLGRPIHFADLTNRWAMDSRYTRALEFDRRALPLGRLCRRRRTGRSGTGEAAAPHDGAARCRASRRQRRNRREPGGEEGDGNAARQGPPRS